MTRRLSALAMIVVLASPNAFTQERLSIATNSTVNDIINKLLGYTTVAYVCENKRDEARLKSKLDQLLALAGRKKSLTGIGIQVYNNSSFYVIAAAEIYRQRPYVTCKEAEGYTEQLIDIADQLVRANSR